MLSAAHRFRFTMRVVHVRTARQGVTLVELLITTVIIGILAMAVALPLNKARQSAMMATVQVELRGVMDAIEAYRSDQMVLPGSVDDLVAWGYGVANNIAYCRFEITPVGTGGDAHVLLEAQHIATRTRLRTRYPGHAGFEEIPAANVCEDLAEEIAGPPGRRVRTGWNR
jgi:prepilin-type N-terminal cleavage/methylation domain-containing protein